MMESTREQIATIQAKQPKQTGNDVARNTPTNASNFARNTPTNAHYMGGAIPAKMDVKATADKARKGK